ncbi:MAG: hypothetical protein JSV65_07875 [Armatimonadota bacterium]|nr:MAG: hypothetical protein JSV65_07875 [Armatimonadota bacterium]
MIHVRKPQRLAAAVLVGLWVACAAGAASDAFRPAAMPDGAMATDYMRILSRFPIYAERGWHDNYQGFEGVGYFGDGESDENGQRTLANFILTYALLATEPGYDAAVSGMSQARIAEHALAAIRYWMRTHLTQDLKCTDGRPWGHHWQSSWWTSKALTGADLLWDRLSESERTRLAEVVSSEADRLCYIEIPTGEYGDTKSEENAWYSETLAWAICLYPQHPHAAMWRERFNAFCMNTLSVAADLNDASAVEGRRVAEWVAGANIHSDFTIENHGFFHICYMACPLHSLAWDVYVFRRFGHEPPPPVFHHVRDVWETLRRFALWEGRFAYVGGKDWPRYAYGLYFMIPALVVQQQYHGDATARLIETQRVAAFEFEQCHWADGSFFSGRFTHGVMGGWPAEWNSDCACMLGMAYLLHKQADHWPQPASAAQLDEAAGGVLLSRESGQVSLRGANRFAGVSYRARGGPLQVTFGARGAEDMMEWDTNLNGRYTAAGFDYTQRIERHAETPFAGGFAIAARMLEGRREVVERRADGGVARALRLSDANSFVGAIRTPHHPLLARPHRITALDGMATLDTIEYASPEWRVLAADVEGRPAIMQARIGKGTMVISMAEIAGDYVAGKPTGKLFENLVALLRGQGPRLGYVPVEQIGRQALDRAGVRYEVVRDVTGADLSVYDAMFVDRSSTRELDAAWPRLMEYVRGGGFLFKLCLQDAGWRPEWLAATAIEHAFTHDIAIAALPDDRTLIRYDRRTAADAVEVTRRAGLRWHVVNDIFNGNMRTFHHENGAAVVFGVPDEAGARARTIPLPGRWLNVDNRVGLAVLSGEGQIALYDSVERRAGASSICFEDVFLPYSDEAVPCARGEVVQETVVALLAGADGEETRRYAEAAPCRIAERSEDAVALEITAPSGERYLIRADFARGEVSCHPAGG